MEVESRWLRRPASLGVENAYRDVLRSWAGLSVAEEATAAVEAYAGIQALVTERIAGVRIKA